MILYIFFFKQKTSYEMRISDWSSDVCSSDLCLARRGGVQPHPKLGAGFGVEDEPAFLLAAWIACRRCGFVVRMDLNRQTLGREEEFDHDRRIVADGVREPDFAHAAIPEIPKLAGNVDAPPWPVDAERFEAGNNGRMEER